jgi:hypothetical protein
VVVPAEAPGAGEAGDSDDDSWQFAAAPIEDTAGAERAAAAAVPGGGAAHASCYARPSLATHTLIVHRTPGVQHVSFVRNLDGRTEARASRVRLPSPALWLWEPRSPSHTRSRYAFELARRAERTTALHPAVYQLTCALLTLEAEEDAAAVTAAAAQWQRGGGAGVGSSVLARGRAAVGRAWDAFRRRLSGE